MLPAINALKLAGGDYSRNSRKRPPREFENVTRAGRLQEYALVSDPMVKQ